MIEISKIQAGDVVELRNGIKITINEDNRAYYAHVLERQMIDMCIDPGLDTVAIHKKQPYKKYK